MIDTDEMAQRLYTAWLEKTNVLMPENQWSNRSIGVRDNLVASKKWKHLSSNEQQVWRHVADAAGKVIRDGLDLVPVTHNVGIT